MEPCPSCKGKCCRDFDSGYRVKHMAAENFGHWCEYCDDGTKYVPPADSNLLRQDGEPWTLHMASYPAPDAESERDSIVTWMRRTADQYAEASDLVGDAYAVTWRIIADLIEKKEDKSGV